MTLMIVIEEAERLGEAGDAEGAESVLERAVSQVAGEQDVDLLLRYAESCHRWGTSVAEETALRAALSHGLRLDAIERLLDMLQQSLNTLKGAARDVLVIECESLGTAAIDALGHADSMAWSNLIHARGLRRLELAKAGFNEKLAGARDDLEAYRAWLVENNSVPAHLQRANLSAFVDLELAELLLLEGRRRDAAERAEQAIAALEAGRVAKWLIDPAYDLLLRASE
jgi:hypothetical protein